MLWQSKLSSGLGLAGSSLRLQRTVCSVQRTVSNVQRTVSNVQRTLSSVQHTVSNVPCAKSRGEMVSDLYCLCSDRTGCGDLHNPLNIQPQS